MSQYRIKKIGNTYIPQVKKWYGWRSLKKYVRTGEISFGKRVIMVDNLEEAKSFVEKHKDHKVKREVKYLSTEKRNKRK